MPDTTSATRRPAAMPSHPVGRAAELKWLGVLAVMLIATVMDGIAVSDLSKPATDVVSATEQAAITLPSDRCEPGCTIMMASNQRSDRFQ